MSVTMNERKTEYTYEEAAQVLNVSMTTLNRAIARKVFHPIKYRGQLKKHLLKSEVDAMIGKQLFSQKKPRKSKLEKTSSLSAATVLNELATKNLYYLEQLQQLKQIASSLKESQSNELKALEMAVNLLWSQVMHDSKGLLPILEEYGLETGTISAEVEIDIDASDPLLLFSEEQLKHISFEEYKRKIIEFGQQVDSE